MIEYVRTIKCHQSDKSIMAELVADAAADFSEETVEIADMPKGYDLALGSYCVTALGELGILDSTGTWNWLGSSDLDLNRLSDALKKVSAEKG